MTTQATSEAKNILQPSSPLKVQLKLEIRLKHAAESSSQDNQSFWTGAIKGPVEFQYDGRNNEYYLEGSVLKECTDEIKTKLAECLTYLDGKGMLNQDLSVKLTGEVTSYPPPMPIEKFIPVELKEMETPPVNGDQQEENPDS